MDQLAPGTYSARATSWAWDASREGTPCLAVRFALEGSDVALDGQRNHRQRHTHLDT